MGYICRYRSNELEVKAGVPQGSILGPVLFLLFINDIYRSTPNSLLYLYADDTSLFVSGKDRSQLEQKIFTEGSYLLQWLKENSLCVNESKTQLIDFAIRKNPIRGSLNILVGDMEISPTDGTEYLGLVLESNLRFSGHVDKVSKTLSSSIFLLSRLACYQNSELLLTAYYGCFYPHLSYAVPIWGFENANTQYIFRLQKRALRIVFRLGKNQSCRTVFRENQVLTFPCIYILESLFFLIKNYQLFTSHNQNSHKYALRSNKNIPLPRHNTTFFCRQAFSSCISLFNALPTLLKQQRRPTTFKKQLKQFLVTKEYYSVQEYLNDIKE